MFITRLNCTRQNRHDPSTHGIFIHGGCNTTAKWWSAQCEERRYHCNRFSLTIPCTTPTHKDDSDDMKAVRAIPFPAFRTFQQALRFALELRRTHPVLWGCGIFSCTDFQYERQPGTGGRLQVQLLSAGRRMSLVQGIWKPSDWQQSINRTKRLPRNPEVITPHTYEDSVGVNGVATPFCKHCRNLYSHPIHAIIQSPQDITHRIAAAQG